MFADGAQGRMIRVSGLLVKYGQRVGFESEHMELLPGLTYLLGPNGAGKTTLFNALSGQKPVRTGSISFLETPSAQQPNRSTSPEGTGVHPEASAAETTTKEIGRLGQGATGAHRRAVRRLVGFLPQKFAILDWSTAGDTVRYAAWSQHVPLGQIATAAKEALDMVGLGDRASSLGRSLSGGMRQRLGIACAIVHRPPFLFLDEPTVGLDPDQRHVFLNMVSELATERVVVLSTHILSDLEAFDGNVLAIKSGKVRFLGNRSELCGHNEGAVNSQILRQGYSRVMDTGGGHG